MIRSASSSLINKIISGFSTLPFDDERCELPVHAPVKRLVPEPSRFEGATPSDSSWILTSGSVVDDRVIGNFRSHASVSLPPEVGNCQRALRRGNAC